MENKIIEDVSSLKTTVNQHEKRIEKLEDTTVILGRMELLLSQQVEMNKEQHITLSNMNTNLTHLNKTQEKMQEDITKLNSKVEKVEKIQEEDKKRYLWDLRGIPKKAISWGLTIILGGISLWIYIKLGLK